MAVKGALQKGRSSAPSIRREVSRIAALTLAGGLNITYLYVPSEYNPADDPSRGVVVPRRRRISAVRAWAKPLFDAAWAPRGVPGARTHDWESVWAEFAARFPDAVRSMGLEDSSDDEGY